MKLATLKQVPLREVWKNEATEFSKWLAKEENLSLLSDEIGIEISLIQTEASVGKFNVDILAQEENTDRTIVIENQLETTDHDHLGKLITYASGFDAEIIIWIVKDVRDEHKQAIDWLNEHSDEKVNFFAIKMEIWQIEDSPYAPKFQIISQPNEWAKAVKKSTKESVLSETQLIQLEFWTEFRKYGTDQNSNLVFRKPNARHWYDISIEIPKAHLSLTADTRNKQIRCGLYIGDDKALFKGLESFKKIINDELNCDLEWVYHEGSKATWIRTIMDADIFITENWENYFSWLLLKTEEFQKVFCKYYRMLD